MSHPFQVADLFCGAGGWSTGADRAVKALGRDMALTCVNHWPRAIETHQRMHPSARHFCQDIATVRPRVAVPGGRLDLLIASPTCTFHSVARGGRPVSDQLRMDPWHVLAWLTELDVDCLLIENVREFVKWGPVDPVTGRPIKSREGEYFDAWRAAIGGLGFVTEWRFINCADHGDATTRWRFFLQARRDGLPITWPDASHAPAGGALTPWRTARDIIEWDVRGRSIFARKRPLAPKTLWRIYDGIERFGWPQPFLIVLRQHMTALGLDVPLPALTAGGEHIGLVEPFVLSQASGGAPRAAREPLPTIPTDGAHALITPYYSGGSGLTCKPASLPLDAITTKARFGMVVPITHAGGHNRARPLTRPLPALTTANGGELALVELAQRYDILFRMLTPRELARAMSFSDGELDYEFAGTKAEIIKQIGNAVPVRTAAALVGAMLGAKIPVALAA